MTAAARRPTNKDIKKYLPVVKRVVRSVQERVPNIVDRENLEGAALVGLLQAFDGFDDSKGVAFEAYAKIRIRGAVQDELRGLDHLTRRQRRRVKNIASTREALEAETGAPASDQAIAAQTELTEAQVAAAANLPTTPQSVDPTVLGEIAMATPWQQPISLERGLIQKQQRELLAKALEDLSEREQIIMSLYYKEELTLSEIGDILGVTQSRVSQIISKVKRKLKRKLADN